MSDDGKAKSPPHYMGHRQRLRDRFMKVGGEAMADYELLELILFQAIPRRDVKPLAKDLMSTFGSFSSVITAPAERLQEFKGLSETAIAGIKMMQEVAVRLSREEIMDKPVLSSWQALINYCRTAMAHRKTEQIRILFLDRKNTLIADELQGEGTVDHTPVYPREVVKRALDLHASALILVHNHPSGNTAPSQGDIAMTKEIQEACAKLNITIHDHLIIGKKGHSSFKSLGLL